jgi:hypothetical protein
VTVVIHIISESKPAGHRLLVYTGSTAGRLELAGILWCHPSASAVIRQLLDPSGSSTSHDVMGPEA